MAPSKPKNVVAFDDEDQMWYRKPDALEWIPAIWHDDIRDELISITDQNGQYEYGRTKGNIPNDVTSFHREHEHWGGSVEHRPDILFELDKMDRTDPDYPIKPWISKGRVVLDADNNPVLNYKEIPLTCSTKIEAWLMNAICRYNSKISPNDFRARMPRDPTGQGLRGDDGNWLGEGKDPLLPAKTYGFQMTRWRQKSRCIAWVERGGTKGFRDYILSLMSEDQKLANSTRGLGDVVDPGERAKIELINEGAAIKRAGHNAINNDERVRRRQIKVAKAQDYERRHEAWPAEPHSASIEAVSQPVEGSRKRVRESGDDGDVNENGSPKIGESLYSSDRTSRNESQEVTSASRQTKRAKVRPSTQFEMLPRLDAHGFREPSANNLSNADAGNSANKGLVSFPSSDFVSPQNHTADRFLDNEMRNFLNYDINNLPDIDFSGVPDLDLSTLPDIDFSNLPDL